MLMQQGYRIKDACEQLAKQAKYVDGGLANYVICGNKLTKLK